MPLATFKLLLLFVLLDSGRGGQAKRSRELVVLGELCGLWAQLGIDNWVEKRAIYVQCQGSSL